MGKIVSIVVVLLFLDFPDLIGKWDLVSSTTFENILVSPAFLEGSEKQQKEVSSKFSLALERSFYQCYKDSVVWTDVSTATGEIVRKRGKWFVSGDTLRVYDLDKIKTYEYVYSVNDEVLELKFILPPGVVSRNVWSYKKVRT